MSFSDNQFRWDTQPTATQWPQYTTIDDDIWTTGRRRTRTCSEIPRPTDTGWARLLQRYQFTKHRHKQSLWTHQYPATRRAHLWTINVHSGVDRNNLVCIEKQNVGLSHCRRCTGGSMNGRAWRPPCPFTKVRADHGCKKQSAWNTGASHPLNKLTLLAHLLRENGLKAFSSTGRPHRELCPGLC